MNGAERDRLAHFYSELSDAKLRELMEAASTLTEDARQALSDEVARRGLVQQVEAAESRRASVRELVTVGTFRDLPAALLAKSILESAGINAFLDNDNLIRMDWLLSNLLGGIKLSVAQEDALVAANLLDKDFEE